MNLLQPICDIPSFRCGPTRFNNRWCWRCSFDFVINLHVLRLSTQSVFPSWKQKNRVVAQRHQDARVPKYTEQSANCLSRNFFANVSLSDLGNCACAFCRNANGSTLADCREKWSKHAKIGSTSCPEDHADPKHNRCQWPSACRCTCLAP